MANHRVHLHIENGGRQWVALGDPSLSTEGCSVLTFCLRHHIQPLPIPLEDVKGPVFDITSKHSKSLSISHYTLTSDKKEANYIAQLLSELRVYIYIAQMRWFNFDADNPPHKVTNTSKTKIII